MAFERSGRAPADIDIALLYDAFASNPAMILEEAGCRITAPNGATLDFPLDTLTPVAWVGFANAALEAHVRPALDAALRTSFGA